MFDDLLEPLQAFYKVTLLNWIFILQNAESFYKVLSQSDKYLSEKNIWSWINAFHQCQIRKWTFSIQPDELKFFGRLNLSTSMLICSPETCDGVHRVKWISSFSTQTKSLHNSLNYIQASRKTDHAGKMGPSLTLKHVSPQIYASPNSRNPPEFNDRYFGGIYIARPEQLRSSNRNYGYAS